MPERPDDICAREQPLPRSSTQPLSPPIQLSTVYRCESTAEAEQLLGGAGEGYVYLRDGHPNADLLAEKLRKLHVADHAVITGSGMAAMSLVLLSQLEASGHVVVSRRLYGRCLQLLTTEARRFGIDATVVDADDLAATVAAVTSKTRLLVVETLANPTLQVADLSALADIAHRAGALLLVDNTFATPMVCRPLEHGADLVLESVTKMINGHSDVCLGALCGTQNAWRHVEDTLSTWGLSAAPFDCWLASRGLATLHLRCRQANRTALEAANFLTGRAELSRLIYPGLASHPQHALARRQLLEGFGAMISFELAGGRAAVDQFLGATPLPFCPSLGEICTTLSHPASTSHRSLPPGEREALGIGEGLLRLSVGDESTEFVLESLERGLEAVQ